MRVKLHKGPAHGKTMEVSDINRDIVAMAAPSKQTFMGNFDPNDIAPMPKRGVYQMKMIYWNDGNNYHYIPCIHPDGSIYFEYVGD